MFNTINWKLDDYFAFVFLKFPPSLVVLVGEFSGFFLSSSATSTALFSGWLTLAFSGFSPVAWVWISDYIWEWWLAGTRFADISLCLTALGNNFIIFCGIFSNFFNPLSHFALFSAMDLLMMSMLAFSDLFILRLLFPPQLEILFLILWAVLSCCWYLALIGLTWFFRAFQQKKPAGAFRGDLAKIKGQKNFTKLEVRAWATWSYI